MALVHNFALLQNNSLARLGDFEYYLEIMHLLPEENSSIIVAKCDMHDEIILDNIEKFYMLPTLHMDARTPTIGLVKKSETKISCCFY